MWVKVSANGSGGFPEHILGGGGYTGRNGPPSTVTLKSTPSFHMHCHCSGLTYHHICLTWITVIASCHLIHPCFPLIQSLHRSHEIFSDHKSESLSLSLPKTLQRHPMPSGHLITYSNEEDGKTSNLQRASYIQGIDTTYTLDLHYSCISYLWICLLNKIYL